MVQSHGHAAEEPPCCKQSPGQALVKSKLDPSLIPLERLSARVQPFYTAHRIMKELSSVYPEVRGYMDTTVEGLSDTPGAKRHVGYLHGRMRLQLTESPIPVPAGAGKRLVEAPRS